MQIKIEDWVKDPLGSDLQVLCVIPNKDEVVLFGAGGFVRMVSFYQLASRYRVIKAPTG